MTNTRESLARRSLGTSPDVWGVWFTDDPNQVWGKQYLDEIAAAGYVYTELGTQGFMPQDPEQLKDELGSRGLTVCGGTVFAGPHKGAEALDAAKHTFGQEAALLSAPGAKCLVHLPEQWPDMHAGESVQNAVVDPEQWKNLTECPGRADTVHLRELRRAPQVRGPCRPRPTGCWPYRRPPVPTATRPRRGI